MIKPSDGVPPKNDGEVMSYDTPQMKGVTEWYQPLKRAIYINGQATTGKTHMESALAVSLLQMCQVVGVFNQSSHTSLLLNVIFDSFQSLGDKRQFHGPLSGGPEAYFEKYLQLREKQTGRKPDRLRAMEELLQRNAATLATFQLLRSGEVTKDTPLFAHSQGNLILCNALTAMSLVDGPSSVAGREVYSYGSPNSDTSWPKGVKLYDSAFTGDPVALLNPMLNFTISKVGLPTGVMPHGFISHGFDLYIKDDAQFVINRFRWGGWGMTVSMDEEGLASALVRMGKNEPRLRAIFLRLDEKHNSDADDIACAYVKKMRSNSSDAAVLKTMKNAPLVPLLIRLMTEGWTSNEEKACIDYLKSL